MRKTLIALALLASTSAVAEEGRAYPSFNCNYAKLPAEVAICQNELLSQLDDANAKVFYGLRNTFKDLTPTTFANWNKEERAWLKKRNSCGSDTTCLETEYRQHLSQHCNTVWKVNVEALYNACQIVAEESDEEEGGKCDGLPGECDDSAITGCGKDVDCN